MNQKEKVTCSFSMEILWMLTSILLASSRFISESIAAFDKT